MNQERGFTLIELIVSISVVVIIFAISIPIYLNYTASRSYQSASEQMKDTIALAYNNSVQGVLGADKDSNNLTGTPANDTDALSDRVAWFVMIDKSANTYATGSCLPLVRPNSISACTQDRDYKFTTVTNFVDIDFSVGSYTGTQVYIVFTPINGNISVWGTSGASPLSVDQPFEVTLTSPQNASESAILEINQIGGITLR